MKRDCCRLTRTLFISAAMLLALFGCGTNPSPGKSVASDAAGQGNSSGVLVGSMPVSEASEDLPPGIRIVHVAETTGQASVYKGDGESGVRAVTGMNLAGGDGFGTGAASGALLELDDDKTLQVGESLRMKIAVLLGDAIKNNTLLTMEEGTTLFRIKRKLLPGETFEVKTPTCTMGVRGTRFFVTVQNGMTGIGVFEGRVEVTPVTSEASILLTGNDWISISAASPGDGWNVEPLSAEKIPAFITDALKKEPDGVSNLWTGVPAVLPEPDWGRFEKLLLGMRMTEAQDAMQFDGILDKNFEGRRVFWFDGSTVTVTADDQGIVSAFHVSKFPMPVTTVAITKEQWGSGMKLFDKPLSEAERILGMEHRVVGMRIDPADGKQRSTVEWRLGEGLWVNVTLEDGLIDTTGSLGEWQK